MKGRLSSLLTCTLGVVILGCGIAYCLNVLDATIDNPMSDVTTEGPVDTEPVLDDNVTPDDLAARYHLRKRTARFFKRVRVV